MKTIHQTYKVEEAGFGAPCKQTTAQPKKDERNCDNTQPALASFKFNPLAHAFVPKRSPKVVSGNDSSRGLAHLPQEALELIFVYIPSALDLVALACTCKTLRQSVMDSRLHVKLPDSLLKIAEPHCTDNNLTPRPLREAANVPVTIFNEHISRVVTTFSGITHLDISHTTALDSHLSLILTSLPALHTLTADSCRKLSSAAPALLLRHRPPSTHPHSGLHHLSLQRCYQLTSKSLYLALEEASLSDSQLASFTLSHLLFPPSSDTAHPSSDPSTPALSVVSSATSSRSASSSSSCSSVSSQYSLSSPRTSSSLRMLALHCCSGVSFDVLQAVCAAAPRLEILLLGGSKLELLPNRAWPDMMQQVHSKVLAVHAEAQQQVHASIGKEACVADSVWKDVSMSRMPQSRVSPLALLITSRLSFARGVAPRQATAASDVPPDVAFIAGLDPQQIATVTMLVYTVLHLPSLQLLEMTHMGQGMSALTRAMLQAPVFADLYDACRPPFRRVHSSVEVWDMCVCSDAGRAATTRGPSPASVPSCQQLAARVAAGSNNSSRYTALHVAASDDEAALAAFLLHLGAPVDARSKSGATALFLACESGHIAVVRVLLTAEADIWSATANGETCLYISALRGHAEVVRLLLSHCSARGIQWLDGRHYGDGWTPLMSAVVAGHVPVATLLLEAAASRAPTLITSRNKYGQTALHLAAYRGGVQIINLLLSYHHSAAWGALRDSSGQTPVQIARKHAHKTAEALLLRKAAVAVA